MIQPGRIHTGSSEEEVNTVRDYERGYRDGHKAGHSDRRIGLKSALYQYGRDERPNWYAQGYNNGYCSGWEAGKKARSK